MININIGGVRNLWLSRFLFFNIAFLVPSAISSSQVFTPDNEVKQLAQQFDREFFPLFLKGLSAINEQDSQLVSEYFLFQTGKEEYQKFPQSIDSLKSSVTPVFTARYSRGDDFIVEFPINWEDNIHPDASWRLWYHSLIWLEEYIMSHSLDSVIGAFKIINDWIITHTDYPAINAAFAFDDHAVAERLIILRKAHQQYEQLGIQIEDFEERLFISILSHLFFVASLEKYSSWHNHAIIFDEKLILALKDFHEFIKREEFLCLAFSRIFEQYRYSFTAEGVHKEHSPCYHIGFTNRLNTIISIAYELNTEIPEWVTNLHENANFFSSTLERIRNSLKIGDCMHAGYLSQSKRKSEEEWLEFLEEIKLGHKLEYMVFPASGWAFGFVGNLDLNVVMQSDFYSYAHYQKDDTSFILDVLGYELLIDPGLYSYNMTSDFDKYYRSAKAHNLLIVDDEDFFIDYSNTGLSGITRFFVDSTKTGEGIAFFEMTHPHYKHLEVDIYRQYLFPGGYNIVIRDLVESRESHKLSQLFHLAPGAIITEEGDEIVVSWAYHPIKLFFFSNHDSFEMVIGQNDPPLGWYFPGLNQKAETPVLVLNKYTDCSESVNPYEFTTRIEIVLPVTRSEIRVDAVKYIDAILSIVNTTDRINLMPQPVPARLMPRR